VGGLLIQGEGEGEPPHVTLRRRQLPAPDHIRDRGDATPLVSINDLRVITPLDRLEVLSELNLGTALVTPNGDGIHDRLELAYPLHGVSAADVEAGVYDLADLSGASTGSRGTGRRKDQTAISGPNVFGFVCPTTLPGEVIISKPWCGLDNRMQVRSGLPAWDSEYTRPK